MSMEKTITFSSAKERLVYFLGLQRVSKNKFYQQSGMSTGLLDKAGGLSEESILKICSVFPELSLDWLLLEKGEILRPSTADGVAKGDGNGVGEPVVSVPVEVMTVLTSQQETINRQSRIIEQLTLAK